MKKVASIIIKTLLGIILLLLVLLFTIPVLFKEKIKVKVEKVINESVNASVEFDDYNIGFFRHFPNLSFSLKGVSVVGINEFSGDTLAGFESFNFVFDLSSLFGKEGYEVKSLILDRAVVNAIITDDGKANWDIMKDIETDDAEKPVSVSSSSSSSGLAIKLKKVALLNSNITYSDKDADIEAVIRDIDFNLSGDFSLSTTDLKMHLTTGEISLTMAGTKYLSNTYIDSEINLLADLDNMEFTFRDNYFSVNDLTLSFTGTTDINDDDIVSDMQFGTGRTAFKTLLSLIPAFYLNDYQDLQTEGYLTLTGSAIGIYSQSDSTLPDIKLSLSVEKGSISYPDLPESIENIEINTDLVLDGTSMDNSTVNISLFHFELAENPFDMVFNLKTPVSDPDFDVSLKGKLDLSDLSDAVPLDSIAVSGIIDMGVEVAGQMSLIEKEKYEDINASGTIEINGMNISMTGYPEIGIEESGFEFSPASVGMKNTILNIGDESDFTFNGKLENYIPYLFSDKTIKGNLSLRSDNVDLSDIMSAMTTDTTATVEDTNDSLSIVRVPEDIDFVFDAYISKFRYDSIQADNLKGTVIIRDGILSIRETGMEIFDGTLSMNADYDTRDTLKPIMRGDFKISDLGVGEAFHTFNAVKKLAPMAKGLSGAVSAELEYESLLGNDMMPLVNTIMGQGKLMSDEITLLESRTFDQIKDILKLGDKYSNTFRNINISFKIEDGRIIVSPFDVKTGNLKMNISGDQGIDQSLNYLVKTEMPRSDLGSSVNSLIDNLSTQASALGLAFTPSDVLKINLKVTGTFDKPVVAPHFGDSGGESGGSVTQTARKVVEQTIEEKVEEVKDMAREEAEIQAARLVEEAEEKGELIKAEAAKVADEIRAEAERQAGNLIEEAESKGTLARIAAKKAAETITSTADKKAEQLILEADEQADRLVEEAKKRSEELVNEL